jgi:hypothetical protein
MPNLLIFPFLLLHSQLSIKLTLFFLLQSIGSFSGKPPSGQSLNEECCLISSFFPHFGIEVHDRLHKLIISSINEDALLFPFEFRFIFCF